jgi:RNA polymerase sigma-70 factor (sigma-E family)
MDQEFERLCRECWPGLVRTAFLVTGDRQEARDIAQEALARAFERWESVSEMENPEGWMHRVAVNLAISRWRRLRARRPRGPAPEELELDALDLDLLRAVRSLPPAQRAVVALRFYADQSVDAVARALGKRPGTVRALTSQALARLRSVLREEEIDDHAG